MLPNRRLVHGLLGRRSSPARPGTIRKF